MNKPAAFPIEDVQIDPIQREGAAGETSGWRKSLSLKLVKALFRRARPFQHSVRGFVYDLRRFMRHSGTLHRGSSEAIVNAAITKSYHSIEKGLALPQPRPGFGVPKVKALCDQIESAMRAGNVGKDVQHAVDAVIGYSEFNNEHGIDNPVWVDRTIATAALNGIVRAGAPTKAPTTRPALSPADCLAFIRSRHSIRHFSDADVPDSVLESATRAAQSAPCVCNRQASNVRFIRDAKLKRQTLACQEGNGGFGNAAPVLAIVTVDLRCFQRPSERNQAWIDGGLFAMNLVLGFHAQRYGTCCLNWSAMPVQDRKLRALGIIDDHENVIMLMAIGGLREELLVARSERRPLQSVMKIL